MMHKFLELNDGTEMVYSDILHDDEGRETVKVYIEKPVHLGFKSAYCYLPEYRWEKVEGFTSDEMEILRDIVKSTSHLVIQFARQGGIGNAANF